MPRTAEGPYLTSSAASAVRLEISTTHGTLAAGVMSLPLVYAVIPARNTADTIPNVLTQLKRSGVNGCFVVANGCTDGTQLSAERAGKQLRIDVRTLQFSDALGPDVPRAVGAYAAVRSHCFDVDLIFVDGDWKGAFGPALGDFIAHSVATGADVSFVGSGAEHQPDRRDLAVWRNTLHTWAPALSHASPSQSPMFVRSRTFDLISPYELHHPGRWFAWCLRAARRRRLSVSVHRDWYARIVGNPTKDAGHAAKMRATLIGDAVEGCSIVRGTFPTRQWQGEVWDGYHSSRRLDLLKTYASRYPVGED